MPPDPDLNLQIQRLEKQVDRLSDRLDTTYVRRDVFLAEFAAVVEKVTRVEERLQWVWRTIAGAAIVSVMGWILVQLLGGGASP